MSLFNEDCPAQLRTHSGSHHPETVCKIYLGESLRPVVRRSPRPTLQQLINNIIQPPNKLPRMIQFLSFQACKLGSLKSNNTLSYIPLSHPPSPPPDRLDSAHGVSKYWPSFWYRKWDFDKKFFIHFAFVCSPTKESRRIFVAHSLSSILSLIPQWDSITLHWTRTTWTCSCCVVKEQLLFLFTKPPCAITGRLAVWMHTEYQK